MADMADGFYPAPFAPVRNSSGPGFNSTLGSSGLYAIESTAVGRTWQGAPGRSLLVTPQTSGADIFVKLGTSAIDVGSSDGTLVLARTSRLLSVQPGQTYVSVFSTTSVVVNFTLGTGF